MDMHRAREILNSHALINVYYYGIPVFIHQVHESTDTATIFPLNEMNNEQVVDLGGLTDES